MFREGDIIISVKREIHETIYAIYVSIVVVDNEN